MNYYKQDENAPRRWGVVAMLLYFLGVVSLLLFVSFRFDITPPEDEGILINFGVTDVGSGVRDLAATDVAAPEPERPRVERVVAEDNLTDDRSEVEIAKPTPEEKPAPEEVEEKPRVVNQRALFPGREEGSTATSQGDSANERGNQGDVSGTPDGASDGTGEGLSGVAYNLTGRSLVGQLPKPDYTENVSGRVVIEVVVDQKGRVTSATYQQQGSTTNNAVLVNAARTAALKARFSEGDAAMQSGTITYIFKMN